MSKHPETASIITRRQFLVSSAYTALAWALGWTQPPPHRPQRIASSPDRPNIILIVWDTVRAQQLHQYGYHRKTTPVFDKLVSQGVLFERAIAPSCWTLPSHASMFTGLWPRTHAACHGGQTRLDEKFETIAELLAKAGYQTIGLSGNHWHAGRRAGISRGFNLFLEPMLSAEERPTPMALFGDRFWPYDAGAMPIERALHRWLCLREQSSTPIFLFINLFEPHYPYIPRGDLVEMPSGVAATDIQRLSRMQMGTLHGEGPTGIEDRAQQIQAFHALYDGEIRYVDESTGHIGELLKSALGADNTLTIIVGDHGEDLGEHDSWGHLFSVYETALHVPLVLRWPGRIPEGVRVSRAVSIVDLFGTIADAARLARTANASSKSSSLLGTWGDASADAFNKPLVSEVWALGGDPSGPPLSALYDGDWKYIRDSGQNRELLFNITQDPGEQHDLAAQEPQRCAKMSAMLDKWLEETPSNMSTFPNRHQKPPLSK